ncbi:MAG: CBS domain-containing protein, partial [Anaerolineae bacterium]|nr:CBS domain-containing protein [Anaerolineae bacterium]
MTVQAIMSTDLVTIEPTVKVKEAVRIMHEHRVGNLPVVAQDGGFVGLFGIRQAIRLMLPKAAQIESGLRDLSFMPDELGELYYRLSKVGERPVSDFLEEDD